MGASYNGDAMHAPPFILFGPAHLWTIALTLVFPLVLATFVRASGGESARRAVRWFFAAELIATWILWYWLIWQRGWISLQTVAPMWLCDWATIATLITLVRPNQYSYEAAYFWAFSGTLQALLTPELFYDFPDLRFIVFFAFHGGVIAAVLYLTFGCRMRPYPSSIPRVLALSLLYLAAAGAVDWLFGTNFGYLRAKPAAASAMDYLGPWPWYIGGLAAMAVAYVIVLYAPFWIADRITGPSPMRQYGDA